MASGDSQAIHSEVAEKFIMATGSLLDQVVELDKALRKTGSMGLRPGISANEFRNKVRSLRDLLAGEDSKLAEKSKWERLAPILSTFPSASAQMFKELGKLAGVTSDSNEIKRMFLSFVAFQSEINDLIQDYEEPDETSSNVQRGALTEPLTGPGTGMISLTPEPQAETPLRVFTDNQHEREDQAQVTSNDASQIESRAELEQQLAKLFKSIQPVLENMVYEITRSVDIQTVENQKYVNLTVIATFLSGVTASVLQIVETVGSGPGNSRIGIAVSTCFYSSLIVSTASAAQSLLAISWLQTIVYQMSYHESNAWRSPAFAWLLRHGPLFTLLVAGSLFTLGLVLYMFASHQHHVTSIVTTSFAGLLSSTILILAVVLFWNRRMGLLEYEKRIRYPSL